MMRARRWSSAALVLVAAAGALSPAAGQGAQLPPPVELRVPKAPTLATTMDGSALVYELYVTNLGTRPLTLTKVETWAAGAPRSFFSLQDSALARSIARPGVAAPAAERTRIDAGLRAVVFLWVPVAASSVPDSIRTSITLEQRSASPDSGAQAAPSIVIGSAVPVARDAPRIGPPLRGGPWLAANGPSNASGHRRALIPIDGTPHIAQRFAIDWVKVDDSSSTHHGDPANNANYYAEGNDALAVADGRVVATKDGLPENVPGVNSRAVPITLETVGGNHVIIDIGGGHYAFYAHLKPGSLRVKVGDRVKRGQVIALVGNTGNSTEPHLHFHISDANSPLGSEGIPYRMESFEVVGRCRSFTSCDRSAPVTRRGEIPLANTLVRFP
jgi:murein DD-endopeptidase MepM/ murein hydrolase activator NlpD